MYTYELWHWEAEQPVEETETVKAAGGSDTKGETIKSFDQRNENQQQRNRRV